MKTRSNTTQAQLDKARDDAAAAKDARIAALEAMLKRLEWIADFGSRCPVCEVYEGDAHAADCELHATLDKARQE